jgi:hypothetical protein
MDDPEVHHLAGQVMVSDGDDAAGLALHFL